MYNQHQATSTNNMDLLVVSMLMGTGIQQEFYSMGFRGALFSDKPISYYHYSISWWYRGVYSISWWYCGVGHRYCMILLVDGSSWLQLTNMVIYYHISLDKMRNDGEKPIYWPWILQLAASSNVSPTLCRTCLWPGRLTVSTRPSTTTIKGSGLDLVAGIH
jgi:hypothetical protein